MSQAGQIKPSQRGPITLSRPSTSLRTDLVQLPESVSGRYLSFEEREVIAIWHAQDVSGRKIARRLGRDPSTISRELRRNASTRTYRSKYNRLVEHASSELGARALLALLVRCRRRLVGELIEPAAAGERDGGEGGRRELSESWHGNQSVAAGRPRTVTRVRAATRPAPGAGRAGDGRRPAARA